MGKWLSQFLAEHQESLPDIPDTMASVSGVSVPETKESAQYTQGANPHGALLPQDTKSVHPPRPLAETDTATPAPQGAQVMPTPPISPGWLVAYRDQQGRLRGGCDERQVGTVKTCEWDGSAWTVRLTNDDTIPLRRIVSVGKTDPAGRILAAWTVRGHGYDGGGTTMNTTEQPKNEVRP